MRRLALITLALATLVSTASVQAQTYDPAYPVCLHVFGRITYYECGYTSLAQCNPTASGRAAQCVINPYYAGAGVADPPPRHRHRRRVY